MQVQNNVELLQEPRDAGLLPEDKQEEVIQPDGFGGSNTVVANAATVESMGVEAEFTWVMNDNFQLNANLGWLDASYDDYVAFGTEAKVKEAGKMRVEGKEYVVQDGDVMHFRFNV